MNTQDLEKLLGEIFGDLDGVRFFKFPIFEPSYAECCTYSYTNFNG